MEQFCLHEARLATFLQSIEIGYNNLHPYHNRQAPTCQSWAIDEWCDQEHPVGTSHYVARWHCISRICVAAYLQAVCKFCASCNAYASLLDAHAASCAAPSPLAHCLWCKDDEVLIHACGAHTISQLHATPLPMFAKMQTAKASSCNEHIATVHFTLCNDHVLMRSHRAHAASVLHVMPFPRIAYIQTAHAPPWTCTSCSVQR